MNEITKCNRCGRGTSVNTMGVCRTCHSASMKSAEDPKVGDGHAVEKNFACPQCRRHVAQLVKIVENGVVCCKECALKYRGKVPERPTEPEAKEKAYMVVSKVSLTRGRRMPTNAATRRFDGDRLVIDTVSPSDDELKRALAAKESGPVAEISVAELDSDQFEEKPDMVAVSIGADDPEPAASAHDRQRTGRGTPSRTRVIGKERNRK